MGEVLVSNFRISQRRKLRPKKNTPHTPCTHNTVTPSRSHTHTHTHRPHVLLHPPTVYRGWGDHVAVATPGAWETLPGDSGRGRQRGQGSRPERMQSWAGIFPEPSAFLCLEALRQENRRLLVSHSLLSATALGRPLGLTSVTQLPPGRKSSWFSRLLCKGRGTPLREGEGVFQSWRHQKRRLHKAGAFWYLAFSGVPYARVSSQPGTRGLWSRPLCAQTGLSSQL